MLLGPPAALLASVVGLIMDQSKKYAIAGLILGALPCLFWAIGFAALMYAHR